MAFGNKNEALSEGSSYEQQQEQDCVWSDLLKGELTQRVIDLRYETAHSDRESKKYDYVGGGVAKKRSIFEFSGNIENSDELQVFLIQENKENISTISNYNKAVRDYNIKFYYDFIPRLRIDSYTKKIVIRKDGNMFIFDIYLSKYQERYNNEHKFFISELKRIQNGDRRSDILQIDGVNFTTYNAFGHPDGVEFTFDNFTYKDIVEYDGNLILRFSCNLKTEHDFIDEVYNEKSESKFKNKEKREGFTQSFNTVNEIIETKKDDDENFEKLNEIYLNGD